MSRPTYMTIDLAALQHNLNRVKDLAPHSGIIAMVKANAYGHGIVRVAEALTNADAFGVASVEEGIKLREAGIQKPIILMEGLFAADELAESIRYAFTLVVHHLPHIEMLAQARNLSETLSIWLKIDTGMHRLGISPEDLPNIYERLAGIPIVAKPIGLMTHFAEADFPGSEATASQIALFNKVTAQYSCKKSLANSAAILSCPNALADFVRPGLMLYGASPFANKTGLDYQLKPVMTLSSRLIAIKAVKAGGKIGYGGMWTAPEDMLVGVVGVGYGDGYPQFAHNGTPVLVNGVMSSLVGRVSMDMLTVDLRPVPKAQIGDPVVLWGNGLPVELVARASQTSAYEILTRMTPRPKIEVKTHHLATEMESTYYY